MAQNIGIEAEVRELTTVIQGLSGGGGGAETDPVFTASDAFPITSADITNWDSKEAGGAAAAALVTANAYTDSEIAALTKADVGLGNVDNTSDLSKPISTATQSALDLKAGVLGADENYVTDAEKVKLSNLSGTNTGDQNLTPYFNKSVDDSDDITEGAANLFLTTAERTKLTNTSGTNTGDQVLPTRVSLSIDQTNNTSDADKPVSTAQATAIALKVTANGAITGATKTKITYDAKGLVTAGADATTADIADSSNKRYVTDANLTVIGNTSGTNTGDQTTVSGNAGSATVLQNSRNINGVAFNGSADITVTAAAGTLSGATLAANVLASSLTSVGTLANLTVTNPITGSVTGSAATLTTPRLIGGVSFNGSADITVATATAGFTVTGGELILATGTATIAPLHFIAGTNETTPEAGDIEFDGVQYYGTIDTSSSRGAVPIEQYFHLTGNGGTISTIANFFGANSNIPLVANAFYVIDIYCYFLNTTAGTVTWTFTNSAAPTSQSIHMDMSPLAGVAVPATNAAYLSGDVVSDATAAKALAVTGTLATAVNHWAYFKIFLQNGTGTSLKIQATKNVGGTITPLRNSFWFCRRLSPSNIGTFAA